ncbi:hypothetical protein PhCBS80983_g01454 [Powellomyces hirtus]|uniref:Uncharacterized protein n=1 Tax=Powellomyces hirtus TaxID=109895 RepID=A0A507EB44_9FUNG|nr:hypothetical protein PhCBS80983_g01454 [Powellomyces hirtus]
MGCDGGSIPRRDELVKTKKAAERADPRMQLIVNWFFCALSKQALVQPVVADALGKLYNKDAILEYLLNKSGFGDGDLICKHITSFKDVVTLNLTPNPLFTTDSELPSATVLGNIDERPMVSRFVCPITSREMNGKHRFSYLAGCGCVLSEQALKNVPTATCLKCNKTFAPDDVIPINPTQPQEIQRLTDLMKFAKERRAEEAEKKKKMKKELKKGKKAEGAATSKLAVGEDGDIPTLRTSSGSEEDEKAQSKKRKKSKKSKDDSDPEDVEYAAHLAKRSNKSSNINMPLPDLNDRSQLPASMRMHSDAIKSLYKKSDNVEEPNFLVRGTFNRFAAGF